MKSFLEQLYYGNLMSAADSIPANREMLQELNKMCMYEEDLKALLNEDELKLFEKFNKAGDEATMLYDQDVFRYGFQLAAHILVEALGNSGSKWFHGE